MIHEASRPLATMAMAGGLLLAASEARALATPFEPNRGQADPRFEFVTRGPGFTLLLSRGEASFLLAPAGGRAKAATVRMTLPGSRARAGVGRDPWPGRVHYLRGRDASKWVREIPLFGRVEYADVYPGVSLVYHTAGGRLEYDFVIAPGADPGRIKLRFEGAERVRQEGSGNLVIETAAGEIVQRAPLLYQDNGGSRRVVAGRLVRRGRTWGFAANSYDRSRPLVIDPAFERISYLGGGGFESFPELAVDAEGKAYVVGATTSPDFPVSPNAPQTTCLPTNFCGDAFVAKIDPAATGPAALVWATYLGGNGIEYAFGGAADASGHAYVVGKTDSIDFPTTAGSFQPSCPIGSGFQVCPSGFIAKLTSDGSGIVYASYVSGGYNVEYGTAPFDEAHGVAVDAQGNAFVSGGTSSLHFPVTPGAFQTTFGGARDAFVLKLNPQGSAALYATYIGGSGTEDYVRVAIDAAGNAYAGGRTDSSNFPTRLPFLGYSGFGDGFIAKLNPSGSDLVYSTCFGGSYVDSIIGIAVDGAGGVSVTGQTKSLDLPLVNPVQGPEPGIETSGAAFVAKLNPAGGALDFSTYLYAGGFDFGSDVAADLEGNTYATGVLGPEFAAKLGPQGSLEFLTGLIGSPSGFAAIDVGAAGRILVVGDTFSPDLATMGAFQPEYAGGGDAYFVVIDPFPERGHSFYTLPPCRAVDTRRPPGLLGGPALEGQVDRGFPLVGTCGIPPGARAVSLNATVTQPEATGNLRLYPADEDVPGSSTLNWSAGQTRGNNAITPLSATGWLAARAAQTPGTITHLILDVNGYFAPPADLVIDIRGDQGAQSFTPSPVWVRAGQTVAWHNADSMPHTATQDGGGFDTGFIAPGATSAPLTMSSTGVLPYHCAFHPGMVGRIDVR